MKHSITKDGTITVLRKIEEAERTYRKKEATGPIEEDGPTVNELLDEIINKEGPYSRDQLTHAENCLDNSSKCAKRIKEKLQEIANNYSRSTDKWECNMGEFLKEVILGEKQ